MEDCRPFDPFGYAQAWLRSGQARPCGLLAKTIFRRSSLVSRISCLEFGVFYYFAIRDMHACPRAKRRDAIRVRSQGQFWVKTGFLVALRRFYGIIRNDPRRDRQDKSKDCSERSRMDQNAKCKTTKQNSILGDIKWSSLSGNQEEGNLEIRLKTT